MADLVFYGNITVSVLGFGDLDIVSKGYADENLVSTSIIGSSWTGGTLTAKATTTNTGLVKIGSGLYVSNGSVSANTATTSVLGIVRPGNCLTVLAGSLVYSVLHKRIYTALNGNLTIDGSYGVYYHTLTSDVTFSFNVAALTNALYINRACEFDLVVNVGSTPRSITFPSNISWGACPSSFEANTVYIFRFRSYDSGVNWFGDCFNKVEEDRSNSIGFVVNVTANETFVIYNVMDGETLPYPVTVNWGDGTTVTYSNGTMEHTYTSAGVKRIVLKSENGHIPYVYFSGMEDKLLSVDWADVYWYDYDGTGLVDSYEGFSGCSELTSIPGSLFARNNITAFEMCFDGCSSLTSIPDDFFSYSSEIHWFDLCFINCSQLENLPSSLVGKLTTNASVQQCCKGCSSLTSIPDGLFDGVSGTTDFHECFDGCTSLTLIPPGLFDDAAAATNFSYCFRGTGIQSIPETLFKKCTAATHFVGVFAACTSLEEVPERLFYHNTSATYFSDCFGGDTSLTTVPVDLFDNVGSAWFNACFAGCSALQPSSSAPYVPPVWEKDKGRLATIAQNSLGSYYGVSNAVKPYIPNLYGGNIPQYTYYQSNPTTYSKNDKVWHDYNTNFIKVYTCIETSTGNLPTDPTHWVPGYVNIGTHDKFVTTLSDATTHTGTSLRDALANAVSGDIIHFAVSGTITLEQDHMNLSTGVTIDGDKRITIDADENCGIFVCGANNCVLRGLTLINSWYTAAARTAIYVTRPITIIDCTFNDDRGHAGAIFSTNQLTLSRCVFTNNLGAGYGGAIYNEGGITLTDCTFTGNSEPSQNGYGGAIYATQTLTATDCVFTGNLATGGSNGKGGAVCGIAGSPSWTFTRCTFTNNSAKVRGGALNHERDGSITCVDCTFTGNTVTDGNAGVANIGSDSFHPSVIFRGCAFDTNSCSYASGNTGVINLYKCASLDMQDCTFSNNESLGTVPVLRITGYASQGAFSIDRCMFTGNNGNGTTDGQIYMNGTVVASISNSVFTANTWNSSKGGYHGCVYISANSANNITVRNCTFTNNTSQRGWYLGGSSAKLNMYNSVDYNNGFASSKASAGILTVSHCLSNKGSWADISYDSSSPLFESDGYTPATGSQVIDAGDDSYVTSEVDFNGEVRIQGSAVDLGAVEFLLPVG